VGLPVKGFLDGVLGELFVRIDELWPVKRIDGGFDIRD